MRIAEWRLITGIRGASTASKQPAARLPATPGKSPMLPPRNRKEYSARNREKQPERTEYARKWRAANPERAKVLQDRAHARVRGRPLTAKRNAAKYGPRLVQLKAEGKSGEQIRAIMNRETGEDRSKSGWRHIHDDFLALKK